MERTDLSLQVTALQTDDAVGQGVLLCLRDILTHDLHQVGQGHHRTAHHEVVLPLLVLTAQVLGMTVLQTDGVAHLLGHTDLLARTVDEFEPTVWEEDGQGDAGEPTACAEVEDLGTGTETDRLGDGQ